MKFRAGTVTCPYIPFLLILSFGTFLRFHALERQSLWDDEMSTIHTISTPAGGLIHRFATYETHPPLYFLQLRLWSALHLRSLVKLRANSALWGSLSLFLVYLLGRRYGGEWMGLLAMAFLALSPFHLAYSQEMRPYAFAMAISLAGWLNLERLVGADLVSARHVGQARGLPLQVFLWTALLYTHYWGAFVVAAQALYGYLIVSPDERKPVLTAFFSASCLFALWLPILGHQLRVIDRLNFWVSAFSIINLGKVFLAYSGILFNLASWTFYLPARVWVLTMIGLLFAAALIKGLLKGPRAVVLWLSVGLGVPWLLSLWKASVFVWYRYPVLMLPAFALIVAAGVLSPKSEVLSLQSSNFGLRTLWIVLLLGSQIRGCWVYFHQWQKANPKAVVQYVHWLGKPNTVVVRPVYFSDLFNFYDQGTSVTLDEHILDSKEKRAALKGHPIILLAFDVPADPIAEALLGEYKQDSARYFPGLAHLGVTVFQLH